MPPRRSNRVRVRAGSKNLAPGHGQGSETSPSPPPHTLILDEIRPDESTQEPVQGQDDSLPQSLNGWEAFLPLLQPQPEQLHGWEVLLPFLQSGPSNSREECHPHSLGGQGNSGRGLEGIFGGYSKHRGNPSERRLNCTLESSEEEIQSEAQSPENLQAPPPPDSPEQQSDFE